MTEIPLTTLDAYQTAQITFLAGFVKMAPTPINQTVLKFVMMVLLLEEKRVTMVQEISTDAKLNALDQEEDGNAGEEMEQKLQLA